MTADLDTRLRQSAAHWLAAQPPPGLRIAREIIRRRKAVPHQQDGQRRAFGNGEISGLRLALSYLGDRPGDVSSSGAEGYLSQVEQADEIAAKGMEQP